MTGKIKPRRHVETRLMNWNDLQVQLDMIFEHPTIKDKKVKGKLSDYEMSQKDMTAELEKAGYSIEFEGDNFIIR